jgi:hypothetical protein
MFTDAEIALAAGVTVRSVVHWRERGFWGPKAGGPEDIAGPYVLGVLQELGVHLADAAWVAAQVVPVLLGEDPPSRLTVGVSKRVMLVLDIAEMAGELKARVVQAQKRREARRAA